MRENHADLPILEKGEMDHSWREDGVRDATETSERANRCDASVRGDFCFFFVVFSFFRGGGRTVLFRRNGGSVRAI